MYGRQAHFMVDDDTMIYLISMGDYSKYLRDLILKDRIAQRDPKVIDQKLKELERQIRDLKQGQTKARELPSADHILNKWREIFITNGIDQGDQGLAYKWVERNVIPELRKSGIVTIDAHKVLELFAGMDK